MLKKYSSIFRTKLLATALLLCTAFQVNAQTAAKFLPDPDFSKPFKRCRVLGSNNGLTRIVASDNVIKNLFYSNDNSELNSVDLETNSENWKTQIVGRLSGDALIGENTLFYISNVSDGAGGKSFTVNAISLRTGITNWQKKFESYRRLALLPSASGDFLFLKAEENVLLALRQSDGSIFWTKNLALPILSANFSAKDSINVLTTESILKIALPSGDLIQYKKIKKNPIANSSISERYFLLGYGNGEFINVSAMPGSNRTLWKTKTGGGISALIELDEKVLVSSLDNFLYLFDADSGKLKWKRRISGRISIKPLIFKDYALVLSSADNTASVINLDDGKVVNLIEIEAGNYFSGPALVSGRFIVFQTFRGIYLFSNSETACQ